MQMHRLFLVFISFWVFGHMLWAQPARPLPVHHHPENGLPEKELYDIIQTPDGLMYIGTAAGLYRFDGIEFRFIPIQDAMASGISALQLGRNGRLWCRNFNKQVFYLENDTLRLFDTFDKVNSVFGFMQVDTLGRLVIVRENGLSLYPAPLKHPYWIIHEHIEFEDINAISPILNNSMVINSAKGCFRFDLISGKLNYRKIIDLEHPLPLFVLDNAYYGWIDAVLASKDEHSLICLTKDQQPQTFRVNGIQNTTSIFQLNSDNKGNVFIGTTTGGYVLKLLPDTSLVLKRHILPEYPVSRMYPDREGNLWVTTLNSGLFFFPVQEVSYFSIEHVHTDSKRKQISSISSKEDQLIIGFENRDIFMLDLESGTHQFLEQISNNRLRNVQHYHLRQVESNDSTLFTLSWQVTFSDYNGENTRSYYAGYIRDFDLQGNRMFVATYHGVYEFDLTVNPEVEPLHKWRKKRSSLQSYRVAFGISDSTIYYKTSEGIFYKKNNIERKVLTPEGHTFNCTHMVSFGGRVFAAKDIAAVVELKNGTPVSTLDWPENIPAEHIRAFHDEGSELFVQTPNHLLFFDAQKNALLPVSLPPTLVSSAIRSLHANEYGLFLAMPDRIAWLKRPLINTNQRPKISLLRAYGINTNYVTGTEILHAYTQGPINLQLQALDYLSGRNLRYQYRLLGSNATWREVNGSAPTITFEQLPPGDYTFEARAISHTGVASKTITQSLVITRPFWMSWWFYGLLTLSGLGIISLLSLYRLQHVQKRAREREELVASQMKALRAQMNPHFIFNALSSIQDLILQQDTRNSIFYLGKFSGLMRRVLEASEVEHISLQKELELLENYIELEALRFERNFSWQINVHKTIDQDSCLIPPMIIQPFVENAIKHGLLHKSGWRELSLDFAMDGSDILRCSITDNGIGRQAAMAIQARQPHRESFSTSAIRERLQLMQDVKQKTIGLTYEDLTKNQKAIGTRTILKVPFDQF